MKTFEDDSPYKRCDEHFSIIERNSSDGVEIVSHEPIPLKLIGQWFFREVVFDEFKKYDTFFVVYGGILYIIPTGAICDTGRLFSILR